MATITRFEDLGVWQSTGQLANEIHQLSTCSEAFYNKAEEFCKKIGARMKHLNKSIPKGTQFKEREIIQNPKP